MGTNYYQRAFSLEVPPLSKSPKGYKENEAVWIWWYFQELQSAIRGEQFSAEYLASASVQWDKPDEEGELLYSLTEEELQNPKSPPVMAKLLKMEKRVRFYFRRNLKLIWHSYPPKPFTAEDNRYCLDWPFAGSAQVGWSPWMMVDEGAERAHGMLERPVEQYFRARAKDRRVPPREEADPWAGPWMPESLKGPGMSTKLARRMAWEDGRPKNGPKVMPKVLIKPV